MADTEYSAVLFYSTNFAVWASKLFEKKEMYRKLISVPRHISSDCGYCVRIESADSGKAEELMKECGIEFDRIEKLA